MNDRYRSLFTLHFTEYTFHMTDARPSHLADSDLPMPSKHLQLYGRFWDVISLLAFGFAAISVVTAHSEIADLARTDSLGVVRGTGHIVFFTIAHGGMASITYPVGFVFCWRNWVVGAGLLAESVRMVAGFHVLRADVWLVANPGCIPRHGCSHGSHSVNHLGLEFH